MPQVRFPFPLNKYPKQIPLKNRKQIKRIKEQKPKKALAFLFPYTNTLANTIMNTLMKKLKRITAHNVGGYKALRSRVFVHSYPVNHVSIYLRMRRYCHGHLQMLLPRMQSCDDL